MTKEDTAAEPVCNNYILKMALHHIVPGKGHDEEFFYHDHSLAYRAIHLMNCCKFASEDILPDVKSHIRDIGTLLLSPS